MAKKRLLPEHPTAKKLAELEEKAHQLGIKIVFHNSQACTVTDCDQPGLEFQIEDVEAGPDPEEFPANFDYKITVEV